MSSGLNPERVSESAPVVTPQDLFRAIGRLRAAVGGQTERVRQRIPRHAPDGQVTGGHAARVQDRSAAAPPRRRSGCSKQALGGWEILVCWSCSFQLRLRSQRSDRSHEVATAPYRPRAIAAQRRMSLNPQELPGIWPPCPELLRVRLGHDHAGGRGSQKRNGWGG